jgi:hypothetical protein
MHVFAQKRPANQGEDPVRVDQGEDPVKANQGEDPVIINRRIAMPLLTKTIKEMFSIAMRELTKEKKTQF